MSLVAASIVGTPLSQRKGEGEFSKFSEKELVKWEWGALKKGISLN